MGLQVVTSAVVECSFGLVPGPLNALGLARVEAPLPAATIMDHIPLLNIPSFGLCSSPANPEVAAATAAAFGVLVPMPCVPVTPAPWLPGSPTVLLGGIPALNNESVCPCMWGGVVAVIEPGQFTTEVP